RGGAAASDKFSGKVDEVRVSSVTRSAEWISAEYANQSSPDTFYTINGSAEEQGDFMEYDLVFQDEFIGVAGGALPSSYITAFDESKTTPAQYSGLGGGGVRHASQAGDSVVLRDFDYDAIEVEIGAVYNTQTVRHWYVIANAATSSPIGS